MTIPSEPPLLLAIDGDSLAHRAYHALPKSIRATGGAPGNALVGFANFLATLWDSEHPAAVVVGFDSLETPTYRHRGVAGLPGGAGLRRRDLEQLALLPAFVESFGFAVGKAPGYEADDFLAAASFVWKGPVSGRYLRPGCVSARQ